MSDTKPTKADALLLAVECAIQFSHAMRDNQEGRVPLALVQTQHDRLRAAVTACVQAWEAK